MRPLFVSLFISFGVMGCSSSSGGGASPGAEAKGLQPCPAGAPIDQCQSFLIDIQGVNGNAPNANDLKAVAGAIGAVVSNVKVQNYFLLEQYAAGGFRACFDPAPNGGYQAAVNEFNVFRVGHDTRFDITPVKNCREN